MRIKQDSQQLKLYFNDSLLIDVDNLEDGSYCPYMTFHLVKFKSNKLKARAHLVYHSSIYGKALFKEQLIIEFVVKRKNNVRNLKIKSMIKQYVTAHRI